MPDRLPRVSAREVIKALERAGWEHVRTTGSHRHFKHPDQSGVVTVPVHAGETIFPAILKSTLRQLGLTVEEFRKLLRWVVATPSYSSGTPKDPATRSPSRRCLDASPRARRCPRRSRAREAISGHIAALAETGQDIPVEDTPALMTVVEVEDASVIAD